MEEKEWMIASVPTYYEGQWKELQRLCKDFYRLIDDRDVNRRNAPIIHVKVRGRYPKLIFEGFEKFNGDIGYIGKAFTMIHNNETGVDYRAHFKKGYYLVYKN